MTGAHYCIGIDLGTTNCVAAFIDLRADEKKPTVFQVPQLTAPGEISARPTLPSFLYFPVASETTAGELDTPFPLEWAGSQDMPQVVIGAYARERGVSNPQRLVSSAKSWLCHGQVDRRAPILPWSAPPGVPRISPVEASALLLAHIRGAWNHRMAQNRPRDRMENQQVFITLPASFDADSRKLTSEAAEMAGIPDAGLLEEPQAAFYSWLASHAGDWFKTILPGQDVLVFDMGGGTTDLSLIRATEDEGETLGLRRIAVGQHLLLGGDNFDSALAREIEEKWTSGSQLPPQEWLGLVFRVRDAKEQILELDTPPQKEIPIALPGRGSRLIGGTRKATVSPVEWMDRLLNGFFPEIDPEDVPVHSESHGLGEFGLPYAQDPAVTHHLLDFLRAHLRGEDGEWNGWPDWVLFNGGVFRSPVLKARVMEVLHRWADVVELGKETLVLENPDPDLAVALGAAQYGLAREGLALHVSAALPRSYYIALESQASEVSPGGPHQKLLCIAPRGMETGESVLADRHPLFLKIGEPVQFPLFSSTSRPQDHSGDLVDHDPDRMTALPPLAARLRIGKRSRPRQVPVFLQSRKDELGYLRIQCIQKDEQRAWELEVQDRIFPAREGGDEEHSESVAAESSGQGHVELPEILDQERLLNVDALLEDAFSDPDGARVSGINAAIEQTACLERNQWPLSLLRRMLDLLIGIRSNCSRSPEHEFAWLNLVGFTLRPGFGDPVDPWRINRLWSLRHEPLHFSDHSRVLTQSWIMWRRVAPGMAFAAQEELAVKGFQRLNQKGSSSRGRRKKAGLPPLNPHEEAEILRMLASLERLNPDRKSEIGAIAVQAMQVESKRRTALWCLARLGARQPFAPSLEAVLPAAVAEDYVDAVLSLPSPLPPEAVWALGRIAQQTGDRFRDLDPAIREKAMETLAPIAEAGDTLAQNCLSWIEKAGRLSDADQEKMLGEHLPAGLTLA